MIIEYFWSSNINGKFGNLSKFNASNLSIGKHKIIFKVKDDNETWSEEVSIQLTVNPTNTTENQIPTVNITYPSNGEKIDKNIGKLIIKGTAKDDVKVINIQIKFDDGDWINVNFNVNDSVSFV